MSLRVRISFRVEAELHARFMEVAAMQQRPAAQILREFMRAYVNEAHECRSALPCDAVSDVERRRREKAVNFARVSVGLEGFKPSKEVEAQTRRFISRDLSLAEFVHGVVVTEIEESDDGV